MTNIFIGKDSKGYNYSYANLETITQKLNEMGIFYNQEIEVIEGNDYIITHIFDKDGKETGTFRGARIKEAQMKSGNEAMAYGAGISYARRYSLMLALGIATVDDESKFYNKEEEDDKDKASGMQVIEKDVVNESAKSKVEKAIVDNAGAEKLTKVQEDKILNLLAKSGLQDKLKYLLENNYKVDNLSKLTKIQADKFISRLEATIKSKAGK